MMKTKAAIVNAEGHNWDVREIDLDESNIRPGEVLVQMAAAGLCQTDEHLRQGDLPARFPLVGGHEGAAVVLQVGQDVRGIEVGDHVVLTFRPSCGLCRFCASGKPNLCVKISDVQQGDPNPRFQEGNELLNPQSLLATFSEFSIVPETSCVVIDKDFPLDVAALLGCAVPTGYGAAVHAAEISAGENCIVIGAGGVGLNAVQGAKIAGAASVVAVDTSAQSREAALEFGADAAVESIEEASVYIGEVSKGRKANAAILTVPVASLATAAIDALDGGGRLVLGALGDPARFRLDLPINKIVMQDISIRGTVMGSASLRRDIPLIIDLYRQGKFKLDELISHRFRQDQIVAGYEALMSGEVLRAIIEYPETENLAPSV